jgi:hypothetical protein
MMRVNRVAAMRNIVEHDSIAGAAVPLLLNELHQRRCYRPEFNGPSVGTSKRRKEF